MTAEEIQRAIESGLAGARVAVRDQGDGRHFYAVVAHPDFAGRSILEQHRMVYGTLGEALGTRIHALGIETCTPEAFEARSA
jgi:acid stress-induced BolA-like protein IbaG/YrbA